MAELAPQLVRSRHLSEITLGELARHNSRENAWVAVDGVVYDATGFIDRHPGQSATILAHAGEDITPILDGFHSARARDLLDRFPIVGRLTEKPRTQPIIAEVGEGGALCNFTVYDPAKKHVVYAVGRDRRVPLHVDEIHEEFRAWVKGDDTFPCIAGKTAVIGYSSYGLGVYDGPIGDQANTEALLHDLRTFIRYQSAEWAAGNRFTTFIAVFPESIGEDKWDDFQKKLRAQLVALQQADNTSKDGMSDLKRDFLVVGLHPAADRKAHRFAYPALVFNSKDQFKYLETTGQMGPIQNAVRRRDKQISGGELVNPLLPQVKLSVPNGG